MIRNFPENSISLIYTPQFAIYEGMGEIAEDVIFDVDKITKILLENFCPNPDEEDTLETLIQQCEIRRGFRKFRNNLAYHKHVDGWKDEDLVSYSKKFRAIPKVSIKATINFISDETWAPYVLAYQGERIIIEKFGNPPSPSNFRKLITEQYLPSALK